MMIMEALTIISKDSVKKSKKNLNVKFIVKFYYRQYL
jgi:hypothetical protein